MFGKQRGKGRDGYWCRSVRTLRRRIFVIEKARNTVKVVVGLVPGGSCKFSNKTISVKLYLLGWPNLHKLILLLYSMYKKEGKNCSINSIFYLIPLHRIYRLSPPPHHHLPCHRYYCPASVSSPLIFFYK